MIIDSHAHLMYENQNISIKDVIFRANQNNVKKIVNVAYDNQSSILSHQMALEFDCLYATLGIDAFVDEELGNEVLSYWLDLIVENKKIIGIGECGLDFLKSDIPKNVQMNRFDKLAEFALKNNLPLIVHNRESDDEVLNILDNYLVGEDRLKAVFHCFTQNISLAEKVWQRGFYTSFSGVVTYPSAKNLVEVVKSCPVDKILIETDSPFLAPQSKRGQKNEPANIVEIFNKILEIRTEDRDFLEETIYQNTKKLFSRII